MDTKALRQKILDLAIHGKLVPQDPNDEPASVLLERIRAEKERLIKEGKIKKGKKSAKTSDKPHYPFELPKGWVWTTLGEIGSWQSGATPSRMNKDYYGGNIPWLKTGDLNDGTITYIPEYITQRALEETSVRLNPKGSVLIAMYGATIGKIGILSFPATTNQACCACYEYSINQMFLFYFLLANRENFIAMGGGGAQPNISKEKIISTSMPLPPLKEQERIVAEIERWLSFVDIVEKEKSDLQSTICLVKSKILDLAIHGKLVPQDPNDEPASELLKRINPKAEIITDNGHYQKLPVGWTICRLKDISKIVTGSTPSKSNCGYYGGIFPFFKPADLDAGRHVYKAAEYLSEDGKRASRVVPKGTTAICCIGTIGKVGYLMYEGATNQQINCAIPSKVVDSVFLFYLCASPLFNDKLNSESSAVTISIVNKSKIEAISVPLPPLAEQKRIVSKIEDIFAQLEAIETAL
jgi:type I restriction enzyme S subunit